MGLKNFMDATIEDIAADPNKYGAPTFEQFAANPGRWRKNSTDILDIASKGSEAHKDIVRHIYYIDGYKCKNEEEVERIATSQGYDLKDFTINVTARRTTGGKKEAVVEFVKNTGGQIVKP